MKNDPLIQILIVVLALSAVASVGLCLLYGSDAHELRVLQGQVQFINVTNARRATLAQLLGEAVEYGKKNPDINPMLKAAGVPIGDAAPATKPK